MRALMALAALPLVSAVPTTEFYAGPPPLRLMGSSENVVRVVFGHLEKCGKPHVPNHPNAVFGSCIRNNGVVYLPNPCSYSDKEEFAVLACHEQAHVNGWGKDHGE